MNMRQVVVVGAGPAGIAAALALKDRGIRPLVVEREDRVAASWRGRYDRLRLNTSRPLSNLPHRRFKKGSPMFLSRDQLVAYLEEHASEEGIEWQFGTEANRVDRDDGGWVVRTSGADVAAAQAIVATGYERVPLIPDWPGRERFRGELLHAAEYRNPERFAGKSVLVVGPGCSGMEIAYDLAEGGAAKVWLSVRTPPNILLRAGAGGMPGDFIGTALMHLPARLADALARFGRRMEIGDLTEFGLPVPQEGVMSRLRRLGVAPAIVDKEVIESIRRRSFEIVPAVEALTDASVELAGGETLEPEAVICATGYRRGLEQLVGHLDVLDEAGKPRVVGGPPARDGLRFLGFISRPGQLGYMGKEAERAAKAIARELA